MAESSDTGWQLAIHPDDRKAFSEAWSQTIGGTINGWRREFLIRRPNGEEIWVNIMATVVATEDSEPAMIVGTFEDITEQKRIEMELRQAMELSETSNRLKSEFLANISHEIRTPMTIFMGMLDLVLDSELTDVQRQYLKTAQIAADSLLVLIEDILDFSRIEAGELKFHKEPFVIATCVDRVAKLFSEKAREKGLELTITISTDAPGVMIGDEERVCQVLTNLLGNAIKFTDLGYIEIIVERRTCRFDSSINGIAFTVRDTGIGISAEKCDFIFQRFTQLDGSATRKYGGSGLGLALSKSLVEGMGGNLWVESEEGKGSAFTFWLPSDCVMAKLPANAPPVISAGGFEDQILTDSSSAHILLAEDESLIAELTRNLLESKGWKVDVAENGQRAVEEFLKGSYDLVLLDVQMPVMDGVEAARRIREYNSKVPIVALTAHALDEDRKKCMDAGMVGFLSKPINSDALLSLIKIKISSQNIK